MVELTRRTNRATPVVLVGVVLLWATPSEAVSLPLNMSLLPTTSTVNRLDVSVSVTVPVFGTDSDSELTRLTGNVLSTLDYDIVNGLPRINTIEFTGGTVNVLGATTDNVTFNLSWLIGSVNIDANNVRGTLDTQTIPSVVTNGNFPTEDHLVRLNQGTLDVTGLATTSVDLASNPVELTQVGIGMIDIQQIAVNGLDRTFQATLTLPVNAQDTIPVNPDVTATVSAVGDLVARANFVVTFPLEGNYNGDNRVDAADYVLWRDANGMTGMGLAADGNNDEVVNDADYGVWQANFGAIAPRLGSGSTAISEPSALLLSLAALTIVLVIPRRKR